MTEIAKSNLHDETQCREIRLLTGRSVDEYPLQVLVCSDQERDSKEECGMVPVSTQSTPVTAHGTERLLGSPALTHLCPGSRTWQYLFYFH